MTRIKAAVLLILCLFCAPGLGNGQAQKGERKPKPWTEWSRRDTDRMLHDSPWARTQVVADAASLLAMPGTDLSGTSARRSRRVDTSQTAALDFYLCLLSAKPIRQAWARRLELLQQNPSEAFRQQLLRFAETRSDEWIAVGVTFESTDTEIVRQVARIFNNATLDSLKAGTFLELKKGGRQFLAEYKNPARDLLGARFRFDRKPQGKPFVTPEGDELRFHAELSANIVLDVRLRISDFMYEGVLEY